MKNVADKVSIAILIAFVIIGLSLIAIAVKNFYDSSITPAQQSNNDNVSDYNKKVIDNSIFAMGLGGAGGLVIAISLWACFKRE